MGEMADMAIDAVIDQWGDYPEDYEGGPVDDDHELLFNFIVSETRKAWLFDIQTKSGVQYQVWLPKSRCGIIENTNVVIVPDWLYQRMKKV